jgi:hypothetical protein
VCVVWVRVCVRVCACVLVREQATFPSTPHGEAIVVHAQLEPPTRTQ